MAGDITPYLALIPPENSQQPDFIAVMSMLLQPLADMQVVTNSIPALYDLDTAVGVQLDTVGQWIGPTRYIYEGIPDVFFSFDILGLGFDQGAWAPNSGTEVLTALPDTDYRLLLYAAVARNHWDGTVPGAEKSLNAFWVNYGYKEYIIDNQDMTVTFLLVGPPMTALVQALFFGGYLDILAAGVGTAGPNNGHIWVEGSGGIPTVPFFGFDLDTPFIQGFDLGYWSGTPVGQVYRCGIFGQGDFSAVLNVSNPDGTFAYFADGSHYYTYTFAGAAVASSTTLTNGVDTSEAAAANGIKGVFAGGNFTSPTVTSELTWSGMTSAAGTHIADNQLNGAACGISTVGIFAIGVGTVVSKYTYSGSTVASGTALHDSLRFGAGVSCSTVAVFACGSVTTTMTSYTYSGDVTAATTSLHSNNNGGSATGNNTVGYFGAADSGSSNKLVNSYTFSGATVAVATSLNGASSQGAAAGISTAGAWYEPQSSSNKAIDLMTYSGDTVVATTSLPNVLTTPEACSNGIGQVTV
jgi:hypothetical protein